MNKLFSLVWALFAALMILIAHQNAITNAPNFLWGICIFGIVVSIWFSAYYLTGGEL